MEIKIGLELHGYLKTKEKLFCKCPTNYYNTKPNTNICPVCTGMPGSKPMLPNEIALKKAIAIALMLDCKISTEFMFQRKHYTWPDLPNGYQKTCSGAYSTPIGSEGNYLGIKISDVHLEEDPARWDPVTGYVDYNRSGMPLVEIVTEPEFKDSKQVKKWLRNLMIMLSYIEAIEKDAGIKSDVNISTNNRERVEIKNVNSIKSITKVIDYEIIRQSQLEKIERETRTYIEEQQTTISMRKKEGAADYRYVPDPDLVTIFLTKDYIKSIKKPLPELPHKMAERFIKQHKISEEYANTLVSNILLAKIYEEVADINPKYAADFIIKEVQRAWNYAEKDFDDAFRKIKEIHTLLKLVQNKIITESIAKKLIEKIADEENFKVEEFVKKKKITIISDNKTIESFCLQAIKENPKAVSDYKTGELKALEFLVGQVMKKTKGSALPNIVKEIFKKHIS